MRCALLLLPLMLTAPAARPAEPEGPGPGLKPVSLETEEELKRKLLAVRLHLKDGGQIEGVLKQFSTETGEEGVFLVVLRDAERRSEKMIGGGKVARVEFTGVVDPAHEGRKRTEKLREFVRTNVFEARHEVRRAKMAGRLDRYIAAQEGALKTAESTEKALGATARLSFAYRSAEPISWKAGSGFDPKAAERVERKVASRMKKAFEQIESEKVKRELGTIKTLLEMLKKHSRERRGPDSWRRGKRNGGLGPRRSPAN